MMDDIARDMPDVVRVLDDVPPVRFPVWLVTHRELRTARRIRVVFDMLADALGAEPRAVRALDAESKWQVRATQRAIGIGSEARASLKNCPFGHTGDLALLAIRGIAQRSIGVLHEGWRKLPRRHLGQRATAISCRTASHEGTG